MDSSELIKFVQELVKQTDVVAFPVLPFESKLIPALEQGKLVVLGACTDAGMERVEGLAKDFFSDTYLGRIREGLSKELKQLIVPLNDRRIFIFLYIGNPELMTRMPIIWQTRIVS